MKLPRIQLVIPLLWAALLLGVYITGFVELRRSAGPLASGSRRAVWNFPDTPTYRMIAGVYAPLFFCLNERVTFDDFQ